MFNHWIRLLFVLSLLTATAGLFAAQDTTETPTPTIPPTITPTPGPIVPSVGEWMGMEFYRSGDEIEYITRLEFILEEDGTLEGELRIFTDAVQEEDAVELVNEQGCVVEFEGLESNTTESSVYGSFVNNTEALVIFRVDHCDVKFFGEATFAHPIGGTWKASFQPNGIPRIDPNANLTPIERGAQIYLGFCSECHGLYAEGAPGYPPFVGEESNIDTMTDEQILEILYNGVEGTEMGPYGNMYTEEQVADLMLLLRDPSILLPSTD